MPGNRAAVYAKPGQNVIEIRDHDIPEPKEDEVLVQFSHSGVCHSDLHLMQLDWAWMNPAIVPGRVGGHEGIGKVVKLGSGVKNLKQGQAVGVKWLSNVCLKCEQCQAGRDGLCYKQAVSGGTVDGTFQEYAVQNAGYVTPIPDGLDPASAAVILCAGVTIYKAIKVANLEKGDWIAIAGGGGGLGHLGIQYAKAMGYRVIAIDGGDEKETLCKKLGADVFVDFRKQDVIKAVSEAADGQGVHGVIVANAAASSYAAACSLARIGGVVVCVGIPGTPAPVGDANLMIAKDLTIRGSAVGTRQDVLEALEFCSRGEVKPIVHTHKLEDLHDIFEQMKRGDIAGRIVVEIQA